MYRSLAIYSETKNLDLLRVFLKDIFVDFGYDLTHFNKVFLGVSEAVCNSIYHGNQLVKSKVVHVEFCCEKEFITVCVKDEGEGFDFNALPDPTVDCNIRKDCGRGIFLIKSIADDLVFFDNGSKVKIRFNFR